MKLITKAIEKLAVKVGRNEVTDPVVIAKFFNPAGRSTWYMTSYEADTQQGFGFVVGEFDEWCDEWCYFSIEELARIRVRPFGITIERDMHFTPQPFTEISALQSHRAVDVVRARKMEELLEQPSTLELDF